MLSKSLLIIGLLSCALTVNIGCASLIHNAVSYSEIVTTNLEKLSAQADDAVVKGYLTKELRQQFAKDVMLPAINEVNKLVTFLRTYDPANPTPAGFTTLNTLLQKGLTGTIAKVTDPTAKQELTLLVNAVVDNVNLWLTSVGKK